MFKNFICSDIIYHPIVPKKKSILSLISVILFVQTIDAIGLLPPTYLAQKIIVYRYY